MYVSELILSLSVIPLFIALPWRHRCNHSGKSKLKQNKEKKKRLRLLMRCGLQLQRGLINQTRWEPRNTGACHQLVPRGRKRVEMLWRGGALQLRLLALITATTSRFSALTGHSRRREALHSLPSCLSTDGLFPSSKSMMCLFT